MLILQELPTTLLPTSVGGYISLVAVLVLAILLWRQRNWRSAAEANKASADAAIVEMNVHKEASERLRQEVKELRDSNAQLNAQRSLEPLVKTISEWVSEGRARFQSAEARLDVNTDALRQNTAALTELIREVKAQRQTSEDSYRSLTAAFIAHTLEDKQLQLEAAHMRERTTTMLDALADRLGISPQAESISP